MTAGRVALAGLAAFAAVGSPGCASAAKPLPYTESGDPKSDVAVSSNWVGEPGVEPLVSYMRRLPREAPPGTHWSYKTGETDLAGILLARAVHEPISKYLSNKICSTPRPSSAIQEEAKSGPKPVRLPAKKLRQGHTKVG
jgi:hypothetical protein